MLNRKALAAIIWAVILLAGAADGADQPRRGSMAVVMATAHQVSSDAALLHDLAEDFRRTGSRSEARALRRLHEFDDEAQRFYRQVRRRPSRIALTHEDFIDLRRSYRDMSRSFGALRSDREAREVRERLAGSIGELRYYYQTGPAERHRRRDAFALAYEIERLADHVYARARDEGRSRKGVDRLKDLRKSAHAFRAQLREEPDDWREIAERHKSLHRRHDRAGKRIDYFSHEIEDDFDTLGRLIDEFARVALKRSHAHRHRH